MLDPLTHPHEEFTSDPSPPTPNERFRRVVESVARKHDVGIRDILSPDFGPFHVQRARLEAYYVTSRTFPGWSMSHLGKLFGRDHTTILSGIRTHARRNGLPQPRAGFATTRRWA